MQSESILLAKIIEQPEDDTVRLEYASWLESQGNPRGEFIRVQCEIARAEQSDPIDPFLPQPDLYRREAELIRLHRDEWLSPLDQLNLDKDQFEFHRGMIEEMECEDRYFIEHGSELFRPELPFLNRFRLVRLQEEPPTELGDLPFFAKVRWLNLEKCPLDDEVVTLLAGSPYIANLRSLHFGFEGTVGMEWYRTEGWLLGPRSADALAASQHLSNLGRLSLPYTQIGDDGVASIAASPHLQRLFCLDIRAGGIESQGVQALTGSDRVSQLISLDLGGNEGIGPAGVAAIAEAERAGGLRVLGLSGIMMGDDGFLHLSGSRCLSSLASLYVDANNIGLKGAASVAFSTTFSQIATLSLRSNNLKADGCEAVVSSGSLTRLRRLYLDTNSIGDDGVASLLRSFRLPHLRRLSLYGNGIGDSGATAIAASPALSHLDSLDLGGNQITEQGAAALLRSPHLQNLRWIGLRTAGFDESVRSQIRHRFGY